LTPALRGQLAKDQVLNLIRLANETFDAIEALAADRHRRPEWLCSRRLPSNSPLPRHTVAGNHVRFSSPEQNGGFPGAGAPVRLPNIVGTARTLELLCTGREIDATELERYGLVERVVPRDDVLRKCTRLPKSLPAMGLWQREEPSAS